MPVTKDEVHQYTYDVIDVEQSNKKYPLHVLHKQN